MGAEEGKLLTFLFGKKEKVEKRLMELCRTQYLCQLSRHPGRATSLPNVPLT